MQLATRYSQSFGFKEKIVANIVQRNYKNDEVNERDRYNEGAPHSHVPNDSSKSHSVRGAIHH